jgi:hypothetical protein
MKWWVHGEWSFPPCTLLPRAPREEIGAVVAFGGRGVWATRYGVVASVRLDGGVNIWR